MKVFSAKVFAEHCVEVGSTGYFQHPELLEMLLRDDGEEVTPYDDDGYINSRLQIVSSDFVVDKDDWEPYVVQNN